jgi:hypothetical protein
VEVWVAGATGLWITRVCGRDSGVVVVQPVVAGARRPVSAGAGLFNGSIEVRAMIFERRPPGVARPDGGSGGMTGRPRLGAVGLGTDPGRRGGAGSGAVAGRAPAPVRASASVAAETGPVDGQVEGSFFEAATLAAEAAGAGETGPAANRLERVLVAAGIFAVEEAADGPIGPCGSRIDAVFLATWAVVSAAGPVGTFTEADFRVICGPGTGDAPSGGSGPEGSRIDAVFLEGKMLAGGRVATAGGFSGVGDEYSGAVTPVMGAGPAGAGSGVGLTSVFVGKIEAARGLLFGGSGSVTLGTVAFGAGAGAWSSNSWSGIQLSVLARRAGSVETSRPSASLSRIFSSEKGPKMTPAKKTWISAAASSELLEGNPEVFSSNVSMELICCTER